MKPKDYIYQLCSTSRWLPVGLVCLSLGLWPQPHAAYGQTPTTLAPVRKGDQIEVQWGGKWLPGTVLSYVDGSAKVSYELNGQSLDGKFRLESMRFPNNEGHWLVWSDASGKFRVEGRYISRTATQVTIRKADNSDAVVPIEKLNSTLRKFVAQTPITGEENKINGANPVRVGDKIQVRSFRDWDDATVVELKVRKALVLKKDYWGERQEEYSFEDMRFPNGEGPWQLWSDASKTFAVVARYISRDATHVTLRKENNTDVRVEISLLSPALRKAIAMTPIITPRPSEIAFAEASSVRNSQTSTANVPTIAEVALPLSEPKPSRNLKFSQNSFGFGLENVDSVSSTTPVSGPDQWIAIGTFGSSSYSPNTAAMLYWVSALKKSKINGPKFLSDERILAYSAEQSRLFTAIVKGTWDEPVRLCSYRIAPGGTAATPEISWPMPDQGRSSGHASIRLEPIGEDRLLWGYGQSISLLNLSTREIEYSVTGLDRSSLWVSPDEQYFAAFDTNRSLSLYDILSGEKLASQSWPGHGASTACFSQDGRYLACANSSGIQVWNIGENKPEVRLPLGGLNVSNDSPMTLLRGGWISMGTQFYSVGLKLVVWRYEARGLSLVHREMIGNEMLAVGTSGHASQTKSILLGAASVPHKDAVELMKKVDVSKLRMLEPGSRIRVEAPGDTKVAQGLRAAIERNGWIEDPGAEVVLKGSAQLGKAETRTYRATYFGGAGSDRPSEETHTVQPWLQTASITYGDEQAWGTTMGGVPGFVTASGKDASLGNELSKASTPSYSLFETLEIPKEILYPKYQKGLGVTWLTPTGFVDESN